jgi:hypothetical protein
MQFERSGDRQWIERSSSGSHQQQRRRRRAMILYLERNANGLSVGLLEGGCSQADLPAAAVVVAQVVRVVQSRKELGGGGIGGGAGVL